MEKEYIQFSKRVTKWGMILFTCAMIACMILIGFCSLPEYAVNAVVSVYTTFSAVLGVTIGAYQGNSSLEKWSRAKYQYDELLAGHKEEETEAAG